MDLSNGSGSTLTTPSSVLQHGDVLKVDIGVQVKGRICDSAFTLNFGSPYDKLLEAVKAATNTGIRVSLHQQCHCRIDAEYMSCKIGGRHRCSSWGARRLHSRDHGILRSRSRRQSITRYVAVLIYLILTRSTLPVKPISNLCGHTIVLYSIHGTKSVPLVATNDMTKMEEGEYFAIETFGSTGRGYVVPQVSETASALRNSHSNHLRVNARTTRKSKMHLKKL